MVDERDCI